MNVDELKQRLFPDTPDLLNPSDAEHWQTFRHLMQASEGKDLAVWTGVLQATEQKRISDALERIAVVLEAKVKGS